MAQLQSTQQYALHHRLLCCSCSLQNEAEFEYLNTFFTCLVASLGKISEAFNAIAI